MAKTTVFGIGDSNARFWESELANALGDEFELKVDGRGGRTIAFDNGDRKSKNTEVIINSFLSKSQDAFGGAPDILFVNLGTNDTKAIFKDIQDSVIADMNSLAKKILAFKFKDGKKPKVVFASPIAADPNITSSKYLDCYLRLKALIPHFKKMCLRFDFGFIDLFNPILADTKKFLQSDGIHLTGGGAKEFARVVVDGLTDKEPPSPPSQLSSENGVFSWQAPTGNILGYKLYAGDSLLAVTDSLKASFDNLLPQTIIARDYMGNYSSPVSFTGTLVLINGNLLLPGGNFDGSIYSISGRKTVPSKIRTGFIVSPNTKAGIIIR